MMSQVLLSMNMIGNLLLDSSGHVVKWSSDQGIKVNVNIKIKVRVNKSRSRYGLRAIVMSYAIIVAHSPCSYLIPASEP